jgi:uncharacterized protein with NRDE domain
MAILTANLLNASLDYLRAAAEVLWIHEDDKPAAVVVSKASYDSSWNLSIKNPATQEELAAYGGNGVVEVVITALVDIHNKLQEQIAPIPALITFGDGVLSELRRTTKA